MGGRRCCTLSFNLSPPSSYFTFPVSRTCLCIQRISAHNPDPKSMTSTSRVLIPFSATTLPADPLKPTSPHYQPRSCLFFSDQVYWNGLVVAVSVISKVMFQASDDERLGDKGRVYINRWQSRKYTFNNLCPPLSLFFFVTAHPLADSPSHTFRPPFSSSCGTYPLPLMKYGRKLVSPSNNPVPFNNVRIHFLWLYFFAAIMKETDLGLTDVEGDEARIGPLKARVEPLEARVGSHERI